ncbi:flavodoxin family protein [Anaerosporobacter faecicola]|uniref:flavodoxin family protein n=1 Tax=Anaerosporobacter faecicola TaxID=2718714 RepID=UPI00143A7E27|nr:flavodoxin family protein [Anaerosporobacter faecicola]
MKVVLINGQNHKGSTYHIGRILAERLADVEAIKEIFLPRDLNHFCLGCYSCIQDEKKCPYFEEKKGIEEMMLEADVLIFTTPTYCMEMSAPLKSYFDLFYQYWIPHRPREYMFHKKAVVISTAAGAGTRSAIKSVIRNLTWWGVPFCMKYGISVGASKWDEVSERNKTKIEKDMDKLSRRLKKAKAGKPSLMIRFMFGLMAKAKKSSVEGAYDANEAAYWREKGWLDGKKPWNCIAGMTDESKSPS